MRSSERAVAINPKFLEGFNNVGITKSQLGDYDGAILSYAQGLKIRPDFVAYLNLGNAFKSFKDPKKALETCKVAIILEPNSVEAYNNMGLAFRDKGDTTSALNYFKQAVKLKTDYAGALSKIDGVFAERGDSEKAILYFELALGFDLNLTAAHRQLSLLNEYTVCDNHLKEMETIYISSQLNDDSTCQLCFALGNAFEKAGNFETSFQYFKRGSIIRFEELCYQLIKDVKFFDSIKKFADQIDRISCFDESPKAPNIFLSLECQDLVQF